MSTDLNEIEVSEDQVIWKYMPFEFFHTLLKSLLWFQRPKNFEDPHDSALPPSYFQRMEKYHEERGEDPNESEVYLKQAEKQDRFAHLVTCWHMNDVESPAMWQQYAGKEGIAIKSTVAGFRVAYPSCGSEQCIYYDEKADNFSSSIFGPRGVLLKRDNWKHEKEFRAWTWDDLLIDKINNDEEIDENSLSKGELLIGTRFTEFLHEIVVAPTENDDLLNKVKQMCLDNGRCWMANITRKSALA